MVDQEPTHEEDTMGLREQLSVTAWHDGREVHLDPDCRMTRDGHPASMLGRSELSVAKLHIDHHENQRDYHASYLAELCGACCSEAREYLGGFEDELEHVERVLLVRARREEGLLERHASLKEHEEVRPLLEERGERASRCLEVLDGMAAGFTTELRSPQGQGEVKLMCARAALGRPPVLAGSALTSATQQALSSHWEAAVSDLAAAPAWVLAELPSWENRRPPSAELSLALEAHEGSTRVLMAPLAVHALTTKEFGNCDSVVLAEPLADGVLETVRALTRDAHEKGDWSSTLSDFLEVAHALV
jgi:hypothetical protein